VTDNGSRTDVIVVGAGHNGLVAAAYLARAGLRVLVLERREIVGGAVGTSELAPRTRVPTLAHTVGRLRPSVVRDLQLREHGLRLVAPDVRTFAPQPGSTSAVVLRSDVHRTSTELRAWSPADAEAYADYDRLVRSLGAFLAELMGSTPPDLKRPGLGDAVGGLRLGRAFRGLGKADARTVLRVLPMAVADFVAESFETDAIRAAVAWPGVRLAALGPWSAGSTAHLLMSAAGTDAGASGETVFARGGPGSIVDALVGAARASGAEIRTGADVASIATSDGRATGVELTSGEELGSRAVVAGVDPKRLLTGMVDPVVLGPSLRWRASNIRTPGVVAKVNLALSATPTFPAAASDPSLIRGRIVVAPGIDALERAFDASKYGHVSDPLALEATIPSLADPSLVEGAPEGTQVMSVIAQYTPRQLADGSWDDDRRNALGDEVLATLEMVAPGITRLVTAREVITPLDLERDFGLTGGHPLHGEPALDLFYAWRPLLGWARYRMPIEGLYLAGSGAHPGGGITGWPGRNAAREILADRKRWPA
jgi:phytoene dehydrogenase-like protein